MLNLSDKELDHFAKEAAQEYDPGDVLGERSWEGLDIRLDRDLGKVHLNPLRHIRRFPFYYAPAMLVLLGASYFLIRKAVGPPGRTAKAAAAVVQNSLSTQSPDYKKTTTLDSPATTRALSAEQAAGKSVGGGEVAAGAGAGGAAAAGAAGAGAAGVHSAGATGSTGSAARNGGVAGSTDAVGSASVGAAGATGAVRGAGAKGVVGSAGAVGSAANAGADARANARSRNHGGRNGKVSRGNNALAITAPANAGRATNGKNVDMVAGVADNETANGASGGAGRGSGNAMGNKQAAARGELGKVALQGLRPTRKAPYISDSALRAFTLKSTAPLLVRKGGVRINRSLELGLVAAPDFASVNSLAGDRPGSTIGVTADYQFANHWYLGSGLLLDRKIFSAYSQDFHEPQGWYAANGVPGHVYLVKGTFEMLEVPINVRYDFTVSGSTMFFVSSGLSSYLLVSQNNNYYSSNLNPRSSLCTPVSTPEKSYLFSALNLSAGVETGLSNSLSLLIAPYMKLPIRGVGIGQVQMSTVGINFAVRFAPVLSRKRD